MCVHQFRTYMNIVHVYECLLSVYQYEISVNVYLFINAEHILGCVYAYVHKHTHTHTHTHICTLLLCVYICTHIFVYQYTTFVRIMNVSIICTRIKNKQRLKTQFQKTPEMKKKPNSKNCRFVFCLVCKYRPPNTKVM